MFLSWCRNVIIHTSTTHNCSFYAVCIPHHCPDSSSVLNVFTLCLSSHVAWAITFIPACVCLASPPPFPSSSIWSDTDTWVSVCCQRGKWERPCQIYHASTTSYPLLPGTLGWLPAWLLMHRCVRGWGVTEVCIFLPTLWQHDMKIYLFLWRKRRPFVGRMGTINSIHTSFFTGLPHNKLGVLDQYCSRQFFFRFALPPGLCWSLSSILSIASLVVPQRGEGEGVSVTQWWLWQEPIYLCSVEPVWLV